MSLSDPPKQPGQASRQGPNQASSQVEDVGYDMTVKLLAEGPKGKTVTAWNADIAARLAAFKEQAPSRKAALDAEKIEKAFQLASELLEELATSSEK